MIFRRKAKTPEQDPADGARKCYADMTVDQHMLLQGFVQTSPARTEMALRPGELANDPSTVVYINPGRPSPNIFVATILVDGLHPSREQALLVQNKLVESLDTLAPSSEIAAEIRSAGYTPTIVTVDLKQQTPAIAVEELPPRQVS